MLVGCDVNFPGKSQPLPEQSKPNAMETSTGFSLINPNQIPLFLSRDIYNLIREILIFITLISKNTKTLLTLLAYQECFLNLSPINHPLFLWKPAISFQNITSLSNYHLICKNTKHFTSDVR
jgi:hypothetical protein